MGALSFMGYIKAEDRQQCSLAPLTQEVLAPDNHHIDEHGISLSTRDAIEGEVRTGKRP